MEVIILESALSRPTFGACSADPGMPASIEQVVEKLQLEPHLNGGFFKETHRDELGVDHAALPAHYSTADTEPRSWSTAIIVLLPGGATSMSALHRVCSDEVYHFYGGTTSMTVVEFNMDKRTVTKTVMGSDILAGEQVQHVIRKGIVWGTYPNSNVASEYALFGATVAPGFDFRDFTMVSRQQMLQHFPDHQLEIERLTN